VTPLTPHPAAVATQAAVVAALRANVGLAAFLHTDPAPGADPLVPDGFGRVYDEGTAPSELVGRWIEVGDFSETMRHAFMGPGTAISATIHAWHTPVPGDDVGKVTVATLWQMIAVILSARLTLDNDTVQTSGVPVLIAIARDADGVSWHAVIRYDVTTRKATP
jgi:hypothetical protein